MGCYEAPDYSIFFRLWVLCIRFEGWGDLVSRLIIGITGAIIWVIGVMNLITVIHLLTI